MPENPIINSKKLEFMRGSEHYEFVMRIVGSGPIEPHPFHRPSRKNFLLKSYQNPYIYLTVIVEKSIIQIGFCYKDKVNKIKRIYNEHMGFLLCYSGTTHFQSVFA